MARNVQFDIQLGQAIGRIDPKRVDATTETDIDQHIKEDEQQARLDAARYAQRVRKKIGLSQLEFARRIHVSVETVRNWEQGKRIPTGAAQALLRIFDKAPEVAMMALDT